MQGVRRSAVAVLLAAAALMVVGCGAPSARTALERAASADHPARFVFVDRPDAASLMECLGAAETLVVTVDTERNAMAVRRQDETNPVVVWTADASFVDASLLTSGVGWVRVGRDLAGPTRAEVEAAVGSSLSGWVFAERIAPDPVTVARSALAVASDISETVSSSGDVTVSVEVDESVGDMEGLDVGPIPDLQFTVVNGRITAIGARMASGDEDSFGFVWEYDQRTDVATVEPPLNATDVSAIEATIGTGNRREFACNLGL